MKESQAESICTLDFSMQIEGMQIEGIRTGKIVSVDDQGQVFVDFADNQQGKIAARFTSSLNLQKLREAALEGREVLLVFENNDPNLPIIINTLHSLLDEVSESTTAGSESKAAGSESTIAGSESKAAPSESTTVIGDGRAASSMAVSDRATPTTILEGLKPEEAIIDGKRITFDAQEEIVLQCGKASITLTRAGKVLVRGEYLLSRSSGVNSIKGGSVQIN
jgi:hypothetical protein